MVDFEYALMKSVVSVFQGITPKGFWIKRFMALALIPIDKIKEALDIIIEEAPLSEKRKTVSFVKYFENQWLNGFISPEIWNHPPSKKPRQAKKDLEKDFQIQLLQEDFDQNRTEFAVYFENLTHREQDLDNEVNQEDDEESEEDEAIIEQTVSKIKVAKLKNDYKNFDFVGNFQGQLKSLTSEESKNDEQQSIAQEQLKSQPSKSNKKKTQEIESESKKSKFEPEQLRVKQEAIPQPSSSNQNRQIYTNDENVQVETFSFFLSDNQWLMGRHIDFAHSRNTCFSIANNWRVEEIIRNKFLMQESPEFGKIFVVNFNNMHWILLTYINPLDAEYKQRLEQEWFVNDILSDKQKETFPFNYLLTVAYKVLDNPLNENTGLH
ncbi:hypothetical protein BpHYR1_029090 [Brachionus plicatilis]|uniref:Uncharacterized protein n=1 Tax=Brachionus plicatilis TaxID=10195 RepID=A0A3M7Q5G2_BRAPC|nr:hypothetical protein BpHYR1_029090 [Brachionus plicatilis]